jgi:hypothetical protein
MTKSILIGDDSQVFPRTTRGFIECHTPFALCGEAIDGLDAVDKARKLRPDLIILDAAMPRLNGLQAAPSEGLVPSRLFYLLFTLKAFVLKTFYLWALVLLFLRRETYRC